MMSRSIRKVHEWASNEDAKLLATDKRLRRSVLVVHDEGSIFCIQSAYLVRVRSDNQDWLVCFSEHQGTLIWAEDELKWYGEFKGRKYKVQKVSLDPKGERPKKGESRSDSPPTPSFEVLDEDDASLPIEQWGEESLVRAGYSENEATFIMGVTKGEIEGDCFVPSEVSDGKNTPSDT